MERLAGLSVPRSTIHRLVGEYGSLLAEERREKAERLWESGVRGEEVPAPREGQKSEIGISLDGMMVWVEDGWHEVKVASCFEFTADYFRERARQMAYPAFRAAGYPIGSGTVESACKGIGWRSKDRGQRWKRKGLIAMLALRSAGMGGEREWKWAWEQIRQAA